ncbi:MAG: MEDS domain-containing protein [Chitinophagaceae bacterium]|nr:MEDS domain-containing protein [Chitinophagaceae bacterium]
MNTDARHQCMIYGGPPSERLPMIAAIIKQKLDEGYRCLYLNSAPMVAGLRSTLSAAGVEVVYEIAKARLILSSKPVSTSAGFNAVKLLHTLEDSLDQALTDGYKGLWASGDMTWEFGPKKEFSQLLEYELRLEELFGRRKEMCGICQYHKDTLPDEALRQSILVHSHFVTSDTLTRINPHYLKSAWPVDPVTRAEMDQLIAELCR